ncbi:hypothetical protein [Nostoc sp.]|uniref:hypothetical protein n=1 Tax=Nostoc sp. TaxID=1180 RepID=UPI002FF4A7D8
MKVSLEAAFRDYLVPSLRLGMLFIEAPPQDLRQSRYEVHFQPLAGNEVLKGFHVTAEIMYLNHICRRGTALLIRVNLS